MEVVMVGATILGAAVSAAGAMEQASATQNQMNYQAEVANRNQQIDVAQAQTQRALGYTQEEEAGMRTRAEVGGIVAEQGAGGLDVRRGSPLAVSQSAERLGYFNNQLLENDAERRSYDYLVKGFSDSASQELYSFGARQAPVAGAFAAGGVGLAGAASAAERWARFGPATTLGT
jgi:hypothetical protein